MEECIHLPFLIVGQLGSHQCRQNPHLHPTFEISPLEIFIGRDSAGSTYLHDALILAIPHIHRLRSLTVGGDILPSALERFNVQTPLLEKLEIGITALSAPTLDSTLFKRRLLSLRELSLGGVVISLPWGNLPNLTTFKLASCPPGPGFVTKLLNFFKCAPLLHTIVLDYSIPKSSDAPPGRIVPLPHLKTIGITADSGHIILLNHLCIPTGVSLTLRLSSNSLTSPPQEFLPETIANLNNLSGITTIHILLGEMRKYTRLSGPSGELNILIRLINHSILRQIVDCRILCSPGPHFLSMVQRLVVSEYEPPKPAHVERSSLFQTLSSMGKLCALVLTECYNLPFILNLNPEKNPSKLVLCPALEELTLYIKSHVQLYIKDFLDTVKERALRGAKLASITIVGLDGLKPAEESFSLKEYVTRVDYRIEDTPPRWDHLPREYADEK